jgi:hypothetical protein
MPHDDILNEVGKRSQLLPLPGLACVCEKNDKATRVHNSRHQEFHYAFSPQTCRDSREVSFHFPCATCLKRNVALTPPVFSQVEKRVKIIGNLMMHITHFILLEIRLLLSRRHYNLQFCYRQRLRIPGLVFQF